MFQHYLGSGRLAVLERWLAYTVTILDKFHCSNYLTCCHFVPQALNSASNNKFLNEMLKIVEMVR